MTLLFNFEPKRSHLSVNGRALTVGPICAGVSGFRGIGIDSISLAIPILISNSSIRCEALVVPIRRRHAMVI